MSLFTAPCPSKNSDWNNNKWLHFGQSEQRKLSVLFSYPIRKESRFWLSWMWSGKDNFCIMPSFQKQITEMKGGAWSQARENHVDAILKKIASGNPSIIVCPCHLACHLLQPCSITFWHLLWCYEVPCLDMGGYQVETPHIGRYREYLLPPSPFKGALPKIIIIYLHQRTYGRGHREYKLTFRGIILILCYQVVTSSESW